jgi:hypothetical protein
MKGIHFAEAVPSNDRRDGFYEILHLDGLGFCATYAKFLKDWFRLLGVNGRDRRHKISIEIAWPCFHLFRIRK